MDVPVSQICQLFHAAASPFVRKVRVVAHEADQALDLIAVHATPLATPDALLAVNPLGKIPTLRTPSGEELYDSRVICRYLGEGAGLYPPAPLLWRALRREALADGLLEAALLARYETILRPEERRWEDWIAGQSGKIMRALAAMATDNANAERPDIGDIATGCALAYLDFRYPQIDWRSTHPGLAGFAETLFARPSFQNTEPE